jgi:hypothetical protein
MGDSIAAEENFLRRHVQNHHTLHRESAKLRTNYSEVIEIATLEALEKAHDVKGANRSGIWNLSPFLKEMLSIIRSVE